VKKVPFYRIHVFFTRGHLRAGRKDSGHHRDSAIPDIGRGGHTLRQGFSAP
jgi:hypothetical protein